MIASPDFELKFSHGSDHCRSTDKTGIADAARAAFPKESVQSSPLVAPIRAQPSGGEAVRRRPESSPPLVTYRAGQSEAPACVEPNCGQSVV